MAFRAFDPCYSCATHSLPGQMPLEVVVHQEAACPTASSGGGAEVVRSLVVGMGNPLLRDDAVGIRLAAFLRGRLGEAPGST